MHLGSSTTAYTLWEIAHERGIALKEKDYYNFVESIEIVKQDSYEKYLKRFDYTEKIQSSPSAVEKCVYEAFSLSYRKAKLNHLELRFNPILRNSEGFYDLDMIIFSAIIGMKKAMMVYPITGGLTLIMDRRFDSTVNTIIAKKAVKFASEGIVGLDLGGPLNPNFKIVDLVAPYAIGRENGLGVTIHTGEVTPPDEVWEVLERLAPHRIGHGIQSVKDDELLKELAKRGTILELCPTSNMRTKECVQSWDEMRVIINKLRDFGVKFTINSDNPVFLQTNVMIEFTHLLNEKILTMDEVKDCTELALKSSFAKK